VRVAFVSSPQTAKRALRQVLTDSQVAAVSIALLLLWSLDAVFRGLWDPAYRLGAFLLTAIAIWNIPYLSPGVTAADRFMLISAFYFLYSAIACLAAAWLLSRWVYGTGPLRSLIVCGSKLTGRKHA
jgi:hypothetical protein